MEFEEYRKASGAVERVHKYYYDDDGIVRFLQVIGSDWLSSSGRYNVYAYVYDGNGNITDLVRVRQLRNLWTYSDATPVAHYEYDAYGNILSETCSDNAAKYNPIKYKGYYYESDTKMYRLDSRYYDPLIGRFLNADDPSLLTESPSALTDKNLYSYCDNNPVNRKDAEGELANVIIGAFASGAISAGFEIVNQVISDGKITDWGAVGKSFVVGAATSVVKPVYAIMAAVAVDAAYAGYKAEGTNGERVLKGLKSGAITACLSIAGIGKANVVMKGKLVDAPQKGVKTRGVRDRDHWTVMGVRAFHEESVSSYYSAGNKLYSTYKKNKGRRYRGRYNRKMAQKMRQSCYYRFCR